MARIVRPQDYTVKRNEILDAALGLVYSKGYEQMTIQDILDALQISKGAFYHYFDSKPNMLEALIVRMQDEAEVVILPILQAPQLTAPEKLKQFFGAVLRWKNARRSAIFSILRIWYADENAIVRQKAFTVGLSRYGPRLTAVVQQGVREGIFCLSNPDQAGELIMRLLQGMGDSLAELILVDPPVGDHERAAEVVIQAYTEALERILGAAQGSIQLIEPGALRGWFGPQDDLQFSRILN